MVKKTQTWALGEGGSLSLMDLCVSLPVVKYTEHEIYCEWLSKLTALTVTPPSPQSSREHLSSTRKPALVSSHSLSHSPPNPGYHQSAFCPSGFASSGPLTQVQSDCGWASTSKHDGAEVLPCWSRDQRFILFSGWTNVRCKDDTPSCCSGFSRTCLQVDRSAGWSPLAMQTRSDPIHLCPYLSAKMLAFMGCLFLQLSPLASCEMWLTEATGRTSHRSKRWTFFPPGKLTMVGSRQWSSPPGFSRQALPCPLSPYTSRVTGSNSFLLLKALKPYTVPHKFSPNVLKSL